MESPVPRFDLWIPAVETGFLELSRLVAWADAQILRLNTPPPWLIELSLAKDLDGLLHASQAVPEHVARSFGEQFDGGCIHLGLLYLTYEAGRINLYTLLREAGEFADSACSRRMPECEAFYLLLNEIDGGGPTGPSKYPLSERVRELFAPMTAEARSALPCLP